MNIVFRNCCKWVTLRNKYVKKISKEALPLIPPQILGFFKLKFYTIIVTKRSTKWLQLGLHFSKVSHFWGGHIHPQTPPCSRKRERWPLRGHVWRPPYWKFLDPSLFSVICYIPIYTFLSQGAWFSMWTTENKQSHWFLIKPRPSIMRR